MLRHSLLAISAVALAACGDGHLRGSVVPSPDGKSYLVVPDEPGGACDQLLVDGKVWKHLPGEAGEVQPGPHTLTCSVDYGFEVPPGVVFTFDYWGP